MANFGLHGFPKAPNFVALANAANNGTASGSTTGNGNNAYFGSSFSLKMASDIDAGSLVCIGPDGLGYPAQTTDYAAVTVPTTGTGTGLVVAPTTVMATTGLTAYDRVGLLQGDNGDIFVVSTYDGSGVGVSIFRYSASGVLRGSLAVDISGSYFLDPHLAMLSNGNLVMMYNNATSFKFIVVDQNLAVIKPLVTVDAIGAGSNPQGLGTLAGGGFALTWKDSVVASQQNLAIYSNDGEIVVAKKAIYNSLVSNVWPRIAQLSNGNIVICLASSTALIGIFTPGGDTVVPFFAGEANKGPAVEVSVLPDCFAIAVFDGTAVGGNIKLRVYSNSGVARGALFSAPAFSVNIASISLVNDGVYFWMSYSSGASSQALARISVDGVKKEFNLLVGSASNRGVEARYDSFYERDRLVIFCTSPTGSSGLVLTVFNTQTFVQESVAVLNAAGHSGASPKMIPGGDFTAIFFCNTTAYGQVYSVLKYAASAIAGVVVQAVAAKSVGQVIVAAGSYGMTKLKGSISKAFDHSAATIPGNKGTMLTYGTVLKGF